MPCAMLAREIDHALALAFAFARNVLRTCIALAFGNVFGAAFGYAFDEEEDDASFKITALRLLIPIVTRVGISNLIAPVSLMTVAKPHLQVSVWHDNTAAFNGRELILDGSFH